MDAGTRLGPPGDARGRGTHPAARGQALRPGESRMKGKKAVAEEKSPASVEVSAPKQATGSTEVAGGGRVAHQGQDDPEVSGFEASSSRPRWGTSATCPRASWAWTRRRTSSPTTASCRPRRRCWTSSRRPPRRSDALYIATDPDREGEAIGWHLAQELGMPKAKTYRIMFNEITERAVKAAFLHPGKIDDEQGGRPAGPARPRPAGGLQALAAPLAEDPARTVGRARAVGRRAADHRARAGDPGLRADGVLVAARPAQGQEPAGVRRHPARGQGREGRASPPRPRPWR